MVKEYITLTRRYNMAKKKKTTSKKRKIVKKAKKKAVKRKVTKKKPAKKKVAKRKPAKKKVAKKKSAKKKVAKKKAGKKKRKANPAFMRNFQTTPALKAVVGASSISRPQATKKIWEYIRKHGLQDKKNRRQINVSGSALGKLFPGKRSVSMFDLPKAVSKHLKD